MKKIGEFFQRTQLFQNTGKSCLNVTRKSHNDSKQEKKRRKSWKNTGREKKLLLLNRVKVGTCVRAVSLSVVSTIGVRQIFVHGISSNDKTTKRQNEKDKKSERALENERKRERERGERLIFRIVWLASAVRVFVKTLLAKSSRPCWEMELICRCVPCTHLISITRSSLQKQSGDCSRAPRCFFFLSLSRSSFGRRPVPLHRGFSEGVGGCCCFGGGVCSSRFATDAHWTRTSERNFHAATRHDDTRSMTNFERSILMRRAPVENWPRSWPP